MEYLKQDGFTPTIIFIVALLILRTCVARYIRSTSNGWTSQQKLRGLGYLRTFSIAALFVGIVYVWGEQIQGLTISLFAVALAIVVSIKETFMSLNGAFLRFQGHAYEIGDRIDVKGVRGDVIDISLLTTTVMEIGTPGSRHQLTGKRVVFPNSLLLEQYVINESFLGNYHILTVRFLLHRNDQWQYMSDFLQKIAKEESSPFIDHARNRVRVLEKSRSIELPSVEPRVTMSMISPDEITLFVRLACPTHLKERLEQVLTVRFLEELTRINDKKMPIGESD